MSTHDSHAAPSRRTLLGVLAGGFGLTATATAARALAAPTTALRAAPKKAATWDLDAVATSTTFGDGATIPYFLYQPLGGGALKGRMPYVEATEGASMTVTVTNSLAVPIRPAVLGVARGPAILPGQTKSFTFTMPPAGTWLLATSAAETAAFGLSRAWAGTDRPTSGLWGTLVSRPASGAQVLYDGGPSFDREYVLLYDDADDRWNAVQGTPGAFSPGPFEPNYYRLNGMGFPDIAGDADTVVAAMTGERVLLRLGNMGRTRQSIHMHGYHFDVATQNNVPELYLGEKDTIGVPWGNTTDIIFTVNQTGAYPFHPHDVQCVTANGLYPFGQLTLIVAS